MYLTFLTDLWLLDSMFSKRKWMEDFLKSKYILDITINIDTIQAKGKNIIYFVSMKNELPE